MNKYVNTYILENDILFVQCRYTFNNNISINSSLYTYKCSIQRSGSYNNNNNKNTYYYAAKYQSFSTPSCRSRPMTTLTLGYDKDTCAYDTSAQCHQSYDVDKYL